MFQDIRFAGRLLLRAKVFAVVAVLTLALGIGATTAVFSIVNGVLLRPLPYRNPELLVDIVNRSLREKGLNKLFAIYPDYREYQRHSRSFQELAAVTWAVKSPILTGHGAAQIVTAIPVSASFFSLLGGAARLGRTFDASDETRGCSVVLSNAYWISAFGADSRTVGQSIALDDKSCAILGVMPASFAFYPAAAQLWTLITPDRPELDKLPVVLFARLKPGATPAQAQAELSAIHAAAHAGDEWRDFGPAVSFLREELTWLAGRNLRATLWILLGAVALVLLIACVNIAGLLQGRSIIRGRELAVRAALGGSRLRLFRQLLTEGLLLATLGGAGGVWIAFGIVRFFRAVNPVELPVGAEVSISGPVLAFTLLVSALTALLFGSAPAWKASRADLNGALKSAGRGNVRGGGVGRAMVAAEMALSVVLLAGAGLLMESVLRMGSAGLGFTTQGLVAAPVVLPDGPYRDADARIRLYRKLQQDVAALPGVEAASLTSSLPPAGAGTNTLQVFGKLKPPELLRHDVIQAWIDPDYFRTLGTAIGAGRAFDAHDVKDSAAVAIVDEALAREYFADADPIGQRIQIAGEKSPWLTIIGIAATQKRTTVYQEMQWLAQPTVFRPFTQGLPPDMTLAARVGGEDLPLGDAIRRVAASIDSGVAIGEVRTMRQALGVYLAYPRFRAVVFGGFAALALLLAVVGLHGVLGQSVSQRTQEIGVRMALGARPADIARMVARQGGAPVLAGLAIGVGCALSLSRLLASMLYGVKPQDPATLACVSVTLLVAAAVAMALPARHAARTDPMAALRQE
jgi:putative ABC transport system permease protein